MPPSDTRPTETPQDKGAPGGGELSEGRRVRSRDLGLQGETVAVRLPRDDIEVKIGGPLMGSRTSR